MPMRSSPRRTFLWAAAGVVAMAARSPRRTAASTRLQTTANASLTSVKALVFDVFGTVVDWRTSVATQVEELARRKGLKVDGAAFADAWRAQYAPSMNQVRTGELPWTTLDRLHRMSLDRLLPEFGVTGLSADDTDDLNRAWHRLNPWPDSVAGLRRLKRKFIIAPLSNGNISLMTRMAKHADLPWDCILGAELAKHYKPDPEVYQSAAGLPRPAAGRRHDGCGASARPAWRQGRRAAHGVRGPGLRVRHSTTRRPDLTADDSVDVSARDFGHLATLLGA